MSELAIAGSHLQVRFFGVLTMCGWNGAPFFHLRQCVHAPSHVLYPLIAASFVVVAMVTIMLGNLWTSFV
jgi:hypothetical protein